MKWLWADQNFVAVAGDWHGDISWIAQAIPALGRVEPKISTILHVGDFWLSPTVRGREYLGSVDYWCKRAGIGQIVVTPGNHEDWSWLDRLFAESGMQPVWVSETVVVLPRGYRFTLADKTFVSFGGAASVDYGSRTPNTDWWFTEVPTEADEIAVIEAGVADVLITHDTVDGGTAATEMVLRDNAFGWSDEARRYSGITRERVTRVWNALNPALLLHGHMHVDDQITLADGRRIVSLGKNNHPNNIGIVNVETLAFEWLPAVSQSIRFHPTM